MRWWMWVVLLVIAVTGLAFWWLFEQGRALEPDNYDFGSSRQRRRLGADHNL